MSSFRHSRGCVARDLTGLLGSLEPELQPGVFVYATAPPAMDLSSISTVMVFRENEALTVITSESEALEAELPVLFRAAWITLQVHSDLESVGLTAACAQVLAEAGISCNVVAGGHHDHVFVPVESGPAALSALRRLQDQSAAEWSSVDLGGSSAG